MATKPTESAEGEEEEDEEEEIGDYFSEEENSHSASSTSTRGRKLKAKVQFSPDVAPKPRKQQEKRKNGADTPPAPAAPSVAQDGAPAPTNPPAPKKRRTESKSSLTKFRAYVQTPIWPKSKDNDKEDELAYTPWQLKTLLCQKLSLSKGTAHKFEIKAGDTFSAYSAVSTQRQVPYTVCWFEKEPGQNNWSVVGVGSNGSDEIRTPVAELISHTQNKSADSEGLRNDVYNRKAKKEADALGARNKVGRQKGASSRQWAQRNKTTSSTISAATDLSDVVLELRTQRAAAEAHALRLERLCEAAERTIGRIADLERTCTEQRTFLASLLHLESKNHKR